MGLSFTEDADKINETLEWYKKELQRLKSLIKVKDDRIKYLESRMKQISALAGLI